MPRVNIYLPDKLAERVSEADINVSAVAQDALDAELKRISYVGWLERAAALAAVEADSGEALRMTRGGQIA